MPFTGHIAIIERDGEAPYQFSTRLYGWPTEAEAIKDWRINHCVGRLIGVRTITVELETA